MLNNQKLFSLINVANVQSGLLKENFVEQPGKLVDFDDISRGIPILVPADPDLFIFENSDVFTISPEQILQTIYGHQDKTYSGFKHAFRGFNFLSKIKVKDQYKSVLASIIRQNELTIEYVSELKRHNKLVGAFQTRNIPHYGHEAIMRRMLDHCNHLVINPVLGPKKRGDATLECLEDVFSNFYHQQFNNRITFRPIVANMYYAGPREAIHHARLRGSIGFDLFSVGRDHAGASGVYAPDAASNAVVRNYSSLGVNVFCHSGAIFCHICNKVSLRDDCKHPEVNKSDISGTEFRKCLKTKTKFPHASELLQEHLFSQKYKVFEND